MTHRDDAIELMNDIDNMIVGGRHLGMRDKLRQLRTAFEMACPPTITTERGQKISQSFALREAKASCALDGETQCSPVLECHSCSDLPEAVEVMGHWRCPVCLGKSNLRVRGGR